MKITLDQLKSIIAEEVQKSLSEVDEIESMQKGQARLDNFKKFIKAVLQNVLQNIDAEAAQEIDNEASDLAGVMEIAWASYEDEMKYGQWPDEEKAWFLTSELNSAMERIGKEYLAHPLRDELEKEETKQSLINQVINFVP